MSQSQYIKMLEKELNKINRVIDIKILKGEDYSKEAKDHKLILKKIKYNSKKNVLHKFFPFAFNF